MKLHSNLETNHSRTCAFSNARMRRFFVSDDLDLDPMTLVYEPDLDILKKYQQTEDERSTSKPSTFGVWTSHTDTL